MSSRLRVLDWNINAFSSGRIADKLDLIERLDWDVATLQELLPRSIRAIRNRFPECTLVVREPNDTWPKPGIRRRTGVLVRPSVELLREVVIECEGDQGVPGADSPVPKEVLVAAEIRVGDTTVTVISAHPPHSAGGEEWRILGKVRTYAALDSWLQQHPRAIVGMDANVWLDASPFDLPALDDTHPQYRVHTFFFGQPPTDSLRDAMRVWLDTHPGELADIRLRRPNGPLALTHVRGGNQPVGDRFDVIMIPPGTTVTSIEHNFEDAVAAPQRPRVRARRARDRRHAFVIGDIVGEVRQQSSFVSQASVRIASHESRPARGGAMRLPR